jgi:hypothetical protein
VGGCDAAAAAASSSAAAAALLLLLLLLLLLWLDSYWCGAMFKAVVGCAGCSRTDSMALRPAPMQDRQHGKYGQHQ